MPYDSSADNIVESFVRGVLHHLYESSPRDQQIAARIIALYWDAVAEDECIRYASIEQLVDFFLGHPDESLPKITLTPDGTLRARWTQDSGSFTAMEFTGYEIIQMQGV